MVLAKLRAVAPHIMCSQKLSVVVVVVRLIFCLSAGMVLVADAETSVLATGLAFRCLGLVEKPLH